MKTPEDSDKDFLPSEFPHFTVFCNLQLCRPMRTHSEHWENAKIIAAIPENELIEMSIGDFLAKGIHYSQ